MIGGFNSYMGGFKQKMAKKKPASGPRAAARFLQTRMQQRTLPVRSAAARQTQQRASAARSVQQGRVIAAQRKAAARGRGR